MATGLIQHSEELWMPLEKSFFFLPHHRSSRGPLRLRSFQSSPRGEGRYGPRALAVPAGKQGREGKDPVWGKEPR